MTRASHLRQLILGCPFALMCIQSAAAQEVAPSPVEVAATAPSAAVVPAAVVPAANPIPPQPEVVENAADEPADDGPSLNVGLGLRTGLALDTNEPSLTLTDGFMGAGGNSNFGGNEALVRPYFSGQLNKYVGFSANFEAYASNTSSGVPIRLLDAIVQLHFDDLFNVWVGQFLPPQDRTALDGPFYLNGWNYPVQVAGYPFDVAARDRGFAIWGQVGGGKFKYQLGAFDLQTGVELADIKYTGRLVLNLLDPEPGYYNSSTYYGTKDVLALGVSGAVQPAKLGDVDAGSYGVQADLLFEKNLQSSGVLTLEGSFWLFENDAAYVTNPGGIQPGSGEDSGLDPTFGSGMSFLLKASWLTPEEIGIGKLQPGVRMQFRQPDAASDPTLTFDATLGYIIDGHNNKLYLGFQRIHPTAENAKGANAFFLGSQIQI